MERIKENAIQDHFNMITRSWTWARMTDEERTRYSLYLSELKVIEAVTGTYQHRWKVLNALYGMFLEGIGYTSGNWREPAKENAETDLRRIREEYLRKQCSPHPFIGHPHY